MHDQTEQRWNETAGGGADVLERAFGHLQILQPEAGASRVVEPREELALLDAMPKWSSAQKPVALALETPVTDLIVGMGVGLREIWQRMTA